jgi:hypothetical protein
MFANYLDPQCSYFKVISDGDKYNQLFTTIVYISHVIYKKGIMFGNVKIDDIATLFPSSKNLILISLNFLFSLATKEMLSFIINYEFLKRIRQHDVTEDEFNELILTKELLSYVFINDRHSIYELITYLCSSETRDKLFPTYNEWFVN